MAPAGLAGDLDGCRSAHERLLASLSSLTDADVAEPSNLGGWTIGHVLSHLARNAEAMCRRIDGAERDVAVEQYPGGRAGRNAEIERGAGRSADEIRVDLTTWCRLLEQRFDNVSAKMWERPVRTVRGDEHPLHLLPFRRWREVEVHMVDLGSTADDWPDAFVERLLPRLVTGVADRTDERTLALWLLGRGSAPVLDPWG